jgi:hypothetical protein
MSALPPELARSLETQPRVEKSVGGAPTAHKSPVSIPCEASQDERISRAVKYLATLPPAIQGSGGSSATFAAARAVVRGFNLGPDIGLDVLLEHYNPRCVPAWSESELRRKCDDAATREFNKPVGWLLAEAKAKTRIRPLKSSPQATHTPETQPSQQPTDPPGQPPNKSIRVISISNFTTHYTDPEKPPTRIGLASRAVISHVLAATGGFPKRVRIGQSKLLFDYRDDKLSFIDSPTKLISMIREVCERTGGQLEWTRRDDAPTRDDFFADCCRSDLIEEFEDVQRFPHFPAIDGVFYAHREIPSNGDGSLDRLISFFTPATNRDRDLIKAAFCTVSWGGPPGRRPMFFVTAPDGELGVGSGKTTLTDFIAQFVGGSIELEISTGSEAHSDLEKRLHSPNAREFRVVRFDNEKGSRISSSWFEKTITVPELSGRANYLGESRRPNYLTWLMTANDATLGKDIVRRVIPIEIKTPVYVAGWHSEVSKFLNMNRWQIFSDIRTILSGPMFGSPNGIRSSWPDWEEQVLSRIADPAHLTATIADRRLRLDDDAETASLIRGVIAEAVRSKFSSDPEIVWCEIEPEPLADLVRKELDCRYSPTNKVCQKLARIRVPGLTRKRIAAGSRWYWQGTNCIAEKPLSWCSIPL